MATEKKETLEHQVKQLAVTSNNLTQNVKSLYKQVGNINSNIRKIYSIWDGFFKTVGVLGSLALVIWLTWLTRGLYYLDGKWKFGTIVMGTIVFIIVLALLILLVYVIVNALLVNKMREEK